MYVIKHALFEPSIVTVPKGALTGGGGGGGLKINPFYHPPYSDIRFESVASSLFLVLLVVFLFLSYYLFQNHPQNLEKKIQQQKAKLE